MYCLFIAFLGLLVSSFDNYAHAQSPADKRAKVQEKHPRVSLSIAPVHEFSADLDSGGDVSSTGTSSSLTPIRHIHRAYWKKQDDSRP